MTHRTYHRLALRAFPAGALGLVLSAGLALPLAAQDAAPTAEDLIAKNLEAKGGREAIAAVESARAAGKMNMGGMEAPFVLEWQSPAKLRMEITIQGMTLVQAYDGETAWMINPFMGKATPEKMSEEETEMTKDQADFHGPLFNPEAKGYTVEYVGEEEVEGTPTYELKVTKPSGEEMHIFLDQEYFLEIKQTSKRTVRGQEVETEMAIGDYKEVGGLLLAHSLDATASGGQGPGGGFNMTLETVELNPELSAERFAMPAAAPVEEVPDGEGGGR